MNLYLVSPETCSWRNSATTHFARKGDLECWGNGVELHDCEHCGRPRRRILCRGGEWQWHRDLVGAFALPANSRDSALLVTLDAGTTYTVRVSVANGGTGEAVVEVYEVF